MWIKFWLVVLTPLAATEGAISSAAHLHNPIKGSARAVQVFWQDSLAYEREAELADAVQHTLADP